jgi:hypothetical protein
MNSLSLEWETFDFYSEKIQKQESIHVSKLSLIKSFLSKKYNFSETKKVELLNDYNKCCKYLLILYKKQLDSLENLTLLNKNLVDIPPEREVNIMSLLELKNVTTTLVIQLNHHQKDVQEMLKADEGSDY